jgi:hypothetical protein
MPLPLAHTSFQAHKLTQLTDTMATYLMQLDFVLKDAAMYARSGPYSEAFKKHQEEVAKMKSQWKNIRSRALGLAMQM